MTFSEQVKFYGVKMQHKLELYQTITGLKDPKRYQILRIISIFPNRK